MQSEIFERAKGVIGRYHIQTCRLMRSLGLETFRHIDTLPLHGVQMETHSMRWEYKLDDRVAYVDGEKAEAANIKWQVVLKCMDESDGTGESDK